MKKYELILGQSSVASTSDKKRVMEMLLDSVLDEHREFSRQSEDKDLNGTLDGSDSPTIENRIENSNDVEFDDK
jgi:hypothetical protein